MQPSSRSESPETIEIETIVEASPHLESVKRLWRANSQWLGFYPEGAFLERARSSTAAEKVRSFW
jgi:hypothetical protein